jgi:hypothetical protein
MIQENNKKLKEEDTMVRVAGIQIAPIFLNSKKTWEKLSNYIRDAHDVKRS